MSEYTSTRVVLAAYASGLPSIENFRIEEQPVGTLEDGEVLLSVRYVSVDAHMRAHDPSGQARANTLLVGSVIEADGTAEVLESRHPDFHPGDLVIGRTGWQSHVRLHADYIHPLPKRSIAEETALVTLGTAALTAYSGLRHVAVCKAGETLVVPAVTGPVGAMAGQLGRRLGMWTVGIVSSPEEQIFARQKLGFHAVVDRTQPDFKTCLAEACSGSIDVYIETTGGALFRSIRPLMNEGGRIVLTGSWGQYSHTLGGAAEYGSAETFEDLLRKQMLFGVPRIQDVAYSDFAKEVTAGVNDGSIWSHVRTEHGLRNAPKAWLTATDGAERGMTVVRL